MMGIRSKSIDDICNPIDVSISGIAIVYPAGSETFGAESIVM